MKKFIALLLFISPLFLYGQQLPFGQAYQNHTSLPAGILQAVSWAHTHYHNFDDSQPRGCIGMPLPYGVMGLFNDGANYFKENGKFVAQLSGISVAQQKSSVSLQIEAYASAFEQIYNGHSNLSASKRVYQTLIDLSEIPDSGRINLYARDAQVFEIMRFLNTSSFANAHNFPVHTYDLAQAFGEENLQVLSAPRVTFTATGIKTEEGENYMPLHAITSRGADYSGAIWDPIPSCNYNSRPSGQVISAITIHDTEGSYAGSISWFNNCSSQVSAHYVIRSSDGQITQCVQESKRAWHVGSENDYTIGIEHEGYVAQTGWYTSAMYSASAALVRNICDRRNISRKRVGYFPWMGTTYYNQSGIPGTCVKIKGHQHYPNQTHDDPGPNWDWENYDNLINNNVPTTTITTANGNFYDTGGASGDYGNDERSRWLIAPPNASEVTLTFSSFNIEDTWDYLYIYDGSSTSAPLIGRYTGTNSPGTVTGTSGKLYLLFKSDCQTTKPGWAATISSPSVDDIAPITAVDSFPAWKTINFTAHFTDSDETGGSGLQKSFYQVLEYNGTNWQANFNNGFFSDNFDSTAIRPMWTIENGTWAINANQFLEQSDESNGNTNIYAPLTQNLSNEYLYTWSGKISGSGTNRRAGFHFFCDDPTQSNRGNSYLVYFRPDAANVPPNKEIQIYKVDNNTLTLEANQSYTLNADNWYNFAVRYNRITGKIVVYVDNTVAAKWTDPNPIANGNFISLRSGNCDYEVNSLKAYRSRYPDVQIKVGPGANNDIHFQNQNPSTPAGKIKSIVVDEAENLSTVAYQFVNVDWTPPQDLLVNDGTAADIDTTYSTTLEANWGTINDPHSGIANYKVAIGTAAGLDDVLPWTTNGMNSAFSHVLANPVYNQVYFISVKAENGAGLSDTISSDGQRYVKSLGVTDNEWSKLVVYPNPTNDEIIFTHLQGSTNVQIYDAKGDIIYKSTLTPAMNKINMQGFAQGIYSVVLQKGNQFIVKKISKK